MTSVMNKEKSKIFETVLCSPGMTDKCKIVLQISRQNVLLLARLIEAGLLGKEQPFEDAIMQALPKESGEEFKVVHEEILRKAELTDFYEKLKSI
ncbi:MAG TPA: hypothetical protein PKC72_14305 [Chitinophagaceae bacterium]|nr:hypothetical protein [Chitinophagaceae bacterium]